MKFINSDPSNSFSQRRMQHSRSRENDSRNSASFTQTRERGRSLSRGRDSNTLSEYKILPIYLTNPVEHNQSEQKSQ
jgi:hypothetical protein